MNYQCPNCYGVYVLKKGVESVANIKRLTLIKPRVCLKCNSFYDLLELKLEEMAARLAKLEEKEDESNN